MLLFIKHIPAHITKNELTRFIASANNRLWRLVPFVTKPKLKKCEVLRIEDRKKETVEFHGLVNTESDKVGYSIIKHLDGANWHGRTIEIRPYIKRSPYKDRRRVHADLELLPEERRIHDRRRHYLHSRTFRCRNDRYS